MSNFITEIPCMIIRGGTSKGLYFLKKDLPEHDSERDKVLLQIMGSPDLNQIDGLGGGKSVTSKVAVIEESERKDSDVNYTFCQVSVDKPLVSTGGNCGNITSGVGPFAIEMGLVELKEPVTTVRIYNTNTDKVIYADVFCEDGRVKYDGDYAIAGVPGTASPVKLRFTDPSGTLGMTEEDPTGLLPTGHCRDELDVPELGKISVSIVDATNPVVFVHANAVGLSGTELPSEIDGSEEQLKKLENVRGKAAVLLGLCQDYEKAAYETPGIPKLAILSEPAAYQTISGVKIEASDYDLCGRMMSMQKGHPSYALTGAMCTVACAAVPGTVANQIVGQMPQNNIVRIGHPGGILEAGVQYQMTDENNIQIYEAYGYRTAKLLMTGKTYFRGTNENADQQKGEV